MSYHWPVRPLLLLVVLVLVVLPAPRHLLPSAAGDAYSSGVTSSGNEQRTRAGLGPVADSPCLHDFAVQQARRMAQQGRLFHQQLQTILTVCGLEEVGENVAFGFGGGPATTDGWMRSPRHRSNLLNPAHRLSGVGVHQDRDGRWYVSQVLGRAAV